MSHRHDPDLDRQIAERAERERERRRERDRLRREVVEVVRITIREKRDQLRERR